MFSAIASGGFIIAQGRSNARHFVGCDRNACPRPAEEQTLLAGARGDPLAYLAADVDPVKLSAGKWPVRLDVDPDPTEVLDDGVGHWRALVAPNRHPHGPIVGTSVLKGDDWL